MLLQAPQRPPAPTPSAASTDEPRSVLVGVDGSDESYAAFMAAMKRAGPAGTVVVIHAYSPVWGWLGSPFYERALEQRLREGKRILRELRWSAGPEQADVRFEQHEGSPADVLARIAALRGVDEIVVGARRLGRLRTLVGGVSQALLRTANRPVLVVPRGATAA